MSKGQLWRGISEVANSGGWPSDPAFTDEGLGIYQSRWRTRVLRLGHAGRTRLHVEMEPSPDPGRGWIVSYYVEQQLVDDPRVSFDPAESDWEDDGQDAQQEEIFAARLRIRLGMDMEMNADGAFR